MGNVYISQLPDIISALKERKSTHHLPLGGKKYLVISYVVAQKRWGGGGTAPNRTYLRRGRKLDSVPPYSLSHNPMAYNMVPTSLVKDLITPSPPGVNSVKILKKNRGPLGTLYYLGP